jgi:hypothetical protein
MANPVKGEVAFEVEGRDYKLVLDFNALCEVEDVLGADGMDLARPKAIRAIFWAALLRHHPDVTVQDAGDLIGALAVRHPRGRPIDEAGYAERMRALAKRYPDDADVPASPLNATK